MFIIEKLNQYRNDFSYHMQCEHCLNVDLCRTGYDAANYYNNVVPAKHCTKCHKNRAGELHAS